MNTAEFDTYAADVYPIDGKPGRVIAAGTVVLANGQVRRAERVWAYRGATLLRYVTPAGRWKTALSGEVFTPQH